MSENHKNRRKLLATVAICAALLGNEWYSYGC